jgi:DNA-binding NarL/FixJ family response regulator
MSLRILIADDHEVVRSGLASLVADSKVQVVAAAASAEQAVELTLKHKPDVVLLDIRMNDADGLTALGKIKAERPDIPVVMLTAYDNPTYIARAIALGANGYLLKGCTRAELLEAITKAAAGQSAWRREDLRRVSASHGAPRAADVDVPLTKRESEVLTHLAQGLTNKEIAVKLGISYETVKEHVQHILQKLGLSDRTQAAVWAVRRGLV